LGLEDAPWTLQLRFDDLTESFMGGVRQLINSDHPAAELLLDEELPGATLAQSVLRMDVARQLLLHVALDPAYGTDEVGWPEGSVGAALQAMSKLYLSSDLTPVLQLARSDLVTFERQVQSGFGLMRTS
jgi:hypothetical protein